MIWALIKVRFLSYLHSMFNRNSKKPAKGGKGLIFAAAGILIYLAFTLYMMFSSVFALLAEAAHEARVDWFYFAAVFVGVFGITLLLGTLVGMGTLYSSKDNDLLLSMPIPPSAIILSRITYVALWDLAYALTAAVAGLVVYPALSELGIGGIISYIIVFIMIILLSLACSIFLGSLLSSCTRKIKNKSLFSVIGMVVFLVGYFYCISIFNNFLVYVMANCAEVAGKMASFLPLKWIGESIASVNILYLLVISLCCVALAVLAVKTVAKGFLKNATSDSAVKAPAKNGKIDLKQNTPMKALIFKELAHLGNSPGYLMNSSLGVLGLIAMGVAAIIKKEFLLALFASAPEIALFMPVFCAMALCGGNAMIFVSAPSVSIEGKNIWLSLCIPVDIAKVLLAKVATHLVLALPATLIAGVCLAVALGSGLVSSALFILVGLLYAVCFAEFGLLVNLKFPRLDYLNETYAAKQGLPTIIVMLVGFASAVVPLILYLNVDMAFLPVNLALSLFCLILAGIGYIFYKRITSHGVKVFSSLG